MRTETNIYPGFLCSKVQPNDASELLEYFVLSAKGLAHICIILILRRLNNLFLKVMAAGKNELAKQISAWLASLTQAADHESWGQPVEASELYKKLGAKPRKATFTDFVRSLG